MRKYVILAVLLLAAGLVYFLGKPKLLGNDRTQIQESIAAFHEVKPEEIQLELVQDAEEQGETYRFVVYLRRDKKEDRDWEEAWDFPYLAVFQQRRNGDFVKMQYNGDRYWLSRSWEHFSVADSNVYYVYDVPGRKDGASLFMSWTRMWQSCEKKKQAKSMRLQTILF